MTRAGPHNNYHYNPNLQSLARENRKNMTKSAACMWKFVLSKNQMLGYQFKRERPILTYIADFTCLELLLIIEVDGWTHDEEDAKVKDRERDKNLASVGFTSLRFSSWEVLNRIGEVSIIINEWIKTKEKDNAK